MKRMLTFLASAAVAVSLTGTSYAQMNIADLLTLANNDPLPDSVIGVVTSVGGGTGRDGFTIQDATGAVLIDNAGTLGKYTVPAVGDEVEISEGNISIFFDTFQLQPGGASDVTILSSGNPLPDPVLFTSVDDFLTGGEVGGPSSQWIRETQNLLVAIQNVHLVDYASATWADLEAAGGAARNIDISDGTDTMEIRLTSDLGGSEAAWQAKAAPGTGAGNSFDLVGVSAVFSGVMLVHVNNPVGTSAAIDNEGPFRPANSVQPPTSVQEWMLY